MALELTLPYPPSVNHYWQRNRNGGMRISDEGQNFRDVVILLCRTNEVKQWKMLLVRGGLSISIDVYPPDARRRDLDNILKSLLDALQHAGCYDDDSLLARIEIARMGQFQGGKVVVRLSEIGKV